tara:strand:- start:1349 stop:5347 length:3999 start_codon:yes stop_codon:yes gene_type:complete
MKNIYLLLIGIALQLNAQTPPELNWSLNPKNGPTSGSFIVSKVIFDEVSSEFNSLPITIGNFTNTGNFNYGNDAAFDYFEDAIGDNINTFITKHNENDEVIWVKKIHGDGVFTATGAIVVGNFFYIVGELNGTVDFNPGSATANRTSNSEKNIVIAKYDLNGFYVNSKLIGGSGLVSAHKIVNNGNKLAIIGELEGTVDFDPNIGVYNLTSSGEKDGYVSLYNTNLAHQWTQQYGNIGTDTMKDIAIDGSYVYTTATAQSTGFACSNYTVPDSYIGDYTLTTLQTGIYDSAVFLNETVTIVQGNEPNERVMSVSPYPEFGAFPAINFTFSLVCGDVIVPTGQVTGVGCGSSTTIGPADTTGSFDLGDDSSFNIIFTDDEGESCGTPYIAEITLTKNGEPIISDEEFDDSIIALDGIHHSDLVVYDITNGEVQSSTSVGSQIYTPLNEINNNIHISSNGEIFVLGSYQGANRFLTYDAVQSDLLVPEIPGTQASIINRIFLSKFEPIASKIEGLNNNLATSAASDFDIIGSSAPGGVNQMYFDSTEPNIALRYIYLIQGEIYFNGAGQIWGQLDADNQVLTSGGAGISIEEEGYYVVKLDYTTLEIILEKIPDFIMSEYVSIRDVVDYYNKTVLSHLNEDNNSLTITYSSYYGTPGGGYYDNDGVYYEIFPSESTDSEGNAIYTYDYVQSVISEVSLTDYQILWEKAGPPINLLNCELIPGTEFIFYLINVNSGSVDLDPRADSEDIINSGFSKVSKYLLDGEYDSSLSFNPRINFQVNYHVHNHISADGSKYFVGHNRAGLDFNNDNNLDLDPDPVNSNSFYLRKYNSSNEFMWMKSIGNPSDVNPTDVNVYAIAEDSQNNLLLYGSYYGDLDFDTLSSNGLMSNPTTTFRYFMAKYSSNGNLIWAKDWADVSYQGLGRISTRNRFVLDNSDNMYFLATLYSNENADPIDIDPSDEAAYYINFPQGNTWYSSIMKFDSDLSVIYAKLMDSELSLTGIFNGEGNGIAINNEVLQFLYVGAFQTDDNESRLIDVDLSEENEVLVESYGREIIVNYNLDGEYIEHHELASNLNNPQNLFHSRSSRPIADGENNIYTKSIYYYTRDEGGWDSPQLIRKFNSNYELQWEKTISNNDLNLASMYPAQLHSSGLIFYKFNYFDYLDLSDVGAGIIYSEAPSNAGSAIVALDNNSGELVHLKNYPNNSRYTEFSVSDEELLVSGNYNNQLELGFNSSAIDYNTYNTVSEQFYASYLLSESLGIDSNTSEINWTVFPNPTSDVITIKINSLDFSELYNALGQRILVSKSPDISLSGLKAGLYFVKVFDKSGREFIKKIIKK